MAFAPGSRRGSLRRGSRLGKYRLEKRLGAGAFAEVWKARDTVEQHPVALKVAFPQVVDAAGRREVEAEARIAARLSHPNVVGVRNADWIGGRFVIACELASQNLGSYTRARRSGPVALSVVRDVAAGLAYAHRLKLMHRDVKPENILIYPDGRAALADFGVSRFARSASHTYTEAGTLGYMAPEQAYSRPGLVSDVFSLGLIAIELLSGVLPAWPFRWPPEGRARFEERTPEPVRDVLRKASEFEPRRRYPDGTALHEALERAFARVERARAPRPRRRRRTDGEPPSPLALRAETFRRSHGAALGMRVGCFRCGGPIGEEMPFCPWCGTADNSFLEVSRYPLVCPECERGVLPEWTACPWCYKGRLAGTGRPPRPDLRAERRCTRKSCTGELRRFMRYCPVCKQKPRRPWSHDALPERCPRCRGPVSRRFWLFCAWCGRREPHALRFPARAS